MKHRSLHLLFLLLVLPLLPACRWPWQPNPPVIDPPRPTPPPSKPTSPRTPKVDPPKAPAKVDPHVKVYGYNPTERPNKSFLDSSNALDGRHTYDNGFVLPGEDSAAIRRSLAGTMVAPARKDFRPVFAIMIFDKNKNPLQCLEVCTGNDRIQVFDARTGIRQQLADPSQAMNVIHKHYGTIISRQ